MNIIHAFWHMCVSILIDFIHFSRIIAVALEKILHIVLEEAKTK